MASNPPEKCCTFVKFHEGKPIGALKDLHGVETYVVGKDNPSSRVIVILTDIYGHKLVNVQLIADQFAKFGKYQVYIPDILKSDPFDPSKHDLQKWLFAHGPEVTGPIVEKFLKGISAESSSSFVGLIGYCFGAKYAIQQIAKNGLGDSAAVAHPSFVTIEEIAAIKKPLLISAAEVDQIYTTELRHATEAKLAEIKARYQLTMFSGVSHGFSVRGDLSDPVVRYAAEKTLMDQIHWFSMS